ncbi:hypothetical protein GCM10007907_31900 [Chitinimonas prasina]|uniref:Uncharacterized protein n=1 Tax=Chitinimonas prasina TaxID=1434937 RepID=A0ABQ5YHB4_9NEIS|nr:hypothetical protein [Chitinimonas prasina]GLR14400.1 hypothetical protein GCM10007907_31900 [Chitinimonas prasina]
MNPNSAPSPQAPSTHRWAISLAGLCLLLLVLSVILPLGKAVSLPYAMGYNLPVALVLFAVYYLVFGRRHGNTKAGIALLAVLVTAGLGSLAAHSIASKRQADRAALQVAVSEIRGEINNMSADLLNGQDGLPKQGALIDTTPRATGSAGEMERFIKTFFRDLTALRNDYQREISNSGWENLLNASQFSQDPGFHQRRALVHEVRQIANTYQARNHQAINNTLASISTLNMSEADKSDLRSGFEQGLVKARRNIDKLWALENQAIDEMGAMVDLLARNPQAWEVEQGNVAFNNQALLDRYNAHFRRVQEIVQEQEAMQRQSLNNANAELGGLQP